MRWLAALLLAASASYAAGGPTRPNLVLILADDLTFRDLGCYGGQAETPNIDRLATQGMRFTRCFQAAPMCSPTRHNLYTGVYPVRSGAYPNHTLLKPGIKTLPQYLKAEGYRVALSGKTHIAPRSAFPFEYSGRGKNPDMQSIDRLIGESVGAGRPFCLVACSNEPHTPWNRGDASRYPPGRVKLPPYIVDTPVVREHFSRYLAEITFFDDQVGRVLDLIDKHGAADRTLVMVLSEQGNSFPFAKWTCYDSGLQSAMVVRWPGVVEAGAVTDAMVEYVDVCPTLVEAAGGTPAGGIEGRSFVRVLRGESARHKEYVYGVMTTRGIIRGSEAYPIRSVRSERYKLILNLNPDAEFSNVAMSSPLFASIDRAAATDPAAARLAERYRRRPPIEFFDVTADPMELNNLADQGGHADEIARLRSRLEGWMADQGDRGMATEMEALERQVKRAQPKGRRLRRAKRE